MPVAIITGGAAGIGRHLCAGFAREGYVVAALDIQPMSSPHPDIHCFPCDLRDEAAITSVFHTIAQTLGTPRVLINNGAVSRFRKPFPLLEAKEFGDVLGTNLRGAFLCCREFVRLCRGTGYGRIINIASTSGLYGTPKLATYCMAKWGVLGLTKTLAKEVGSKGIIVNALCPTKVKTPMCETQSYVEFINELTGKNFKDYKEMYAGVPFLDVEDISDMVYWLGTSRAAGKFNGRDVALDLGTLQC